MQTQGSDSPPGLGVRDDDDDDDEAKVAQATPEKDAMIKEDPTLKMWSQRGVTDDTETNQGEGTASASCLEIFHEDGNKATSVEAVTSAQPASVHQDHSTDSSTPGCSRADTTDIGEKLSPPSARSPSVDSSSSTTSSEWSIMLEKVKALTSAVEPHITRTPATPVRVERLPSIGSCCCRICQSNTSPESLISPCRCKGSLAYVHLSCLERWLNQSGRTYCELCQFHFNAIQTPRYRLLQSMRLWYCHPRHRRQLLADALIALILTCVTLGLVSIIVLGMRYFILEGAKLGVSPQCTQFTITFFLAAVTSGYMITMYLLVKDQVAPWMHWRRTNVDVRVLLDANRPTFSPKTNL